MLRYYLPITNNCNRSCEYCCVYSNPQKKTFMKFEWIEEFFNKIDEEFEIQLEGGEPLVHNEYDNIFNYFYDNDNCVKITLTTNVSRILLDEEHHQSYFEIYDKKPIVIKPSINEHLIKRDSELLDKCEMLNEIASNLQNVEVTFNVRRRKGVENDDQWIIDELEKRNLINNSNIFFYQRYGLAKDMVEYDEPFIIENPVDFHLMTPDGKDFGTDMLARSEYMKNLK